MTVASLLIALWGMLFQTFPAPGTSTRAPASGGGGGITLISHGCMASTDQTNVTVTLNTTGANVIAIYYSYLAGAGGGVVVTDSVGGMSNTITTLTGAASSGVEGRLAYILSPTHTGTSHAFTISNGGAYPNLTVAAFSGAMGTFGTNTGTATDSTVSSLQPGIITPGSNGFLLFTGFGDNGDDTSSWMINSSFVKLDYCASVSSAAFAGGAAYLVQGTAGAVNPTWSFTSNSSVASVMMSIQ